MSAAYKGKTLSPLKAMRAYCLWCCGDSPKEVSLCPSQACGLYAYRLGKISPGASRHLVKVIKARCAECCQSPKDCEAATPYVIHEPCQLWPYRLGRNPNVSQDKREKLREHGRRTGFKRGSQPYFAPGIDAKPCA